MTEDKKIPEEESLDSVEENDNFDFDSSSDEQEAPPDPLAEESEAEAPPPSATTPPKNSFLPIVIVLSVIGFLGWKLYHMFMPPPDAAVQEQEALPQPLLSSKAASPPDTLPTLTQPAQEVIQTPLSEMPSLADTASKSTPPPLSSDTPLPKNVQKPKPDATVASLQDKWEVLEKEISTTNQSNTDISKQLNALQQQISQLSATVTALNAQIKSPRAATGSVPPEKPKKKIVSAPKPNVARRVAPALSVYAIIPGRAWLRYANGQIITVAEGDSLGAYGKVLRVDAGNSVVVTSSGVTLR